jgi:hypothetical protein
MDPSARQSTPGTELRLAMGMRGGVSLAVWMGGACSEVDRLRHALDDDPADHPVYRRLLEAGGHTSVAVDVLAGASAGGLNSVLLSCSVVHGMRFDSRIRDLWLRLGDLGRLLRRDGGMQPASLLDGDAAFYGALSSELRTLIPSDAPRARRPRLDTILTCTLFAGAPRTRYPDLGPPIVERRNRAWFRFRSRPGEDDASDSDFGSGDDLRGALDRLAYAARATSSFPGAFEPASIGFAPPPDDGTAPEAGIALPTSHYGVYSESRLPSRAEKAQGIDRDFVIDGGVLDNIPLAWAVRSIAAAPADCPVDRWLLYLQPIPFAPPPPASPDRPRTFDTVHRARELKGGTEALADDLDELERLRRDGMRRRGFQQVLEYALGQAPEGTSGPEFLVQLCQRALHARATYRERAGAMEAGRIRELWTDPMSVLGADPLGFAGATRDPLPRTHACMLALLPEGGADLVLPAGPDGDDPPSGAAAVVALAEEVPRFRSSQVLARTVSVLLDAARSLGEDGLALKAELYEVREDVELLVARADRALAAAPGALPDPPTTPAALVEVVRTALPGAGAGWPSHDDVWSRLVDRARDVAAAAAKRTAEPDAAESRAFVGCLVRAADDAEDPVRATRAVLAAVELLTGPLRPDPLAETTPVRFHMISAMNRSPLVPQTGGAPDRPSADKLAGNQLSNFGAFLSARWRLNDWIWGRLDGSASLVDVLLQGLDPDGPAMAALHADLGLLPPKAPATMLDGVRAECVRRLHDAVLREELPLLARIGDEPPPADSPAVPGLPPGAALDTTALQAIGREKVRDLAMRSGGRLPDVARLAGMAGLVVAGGVVQRTARQVADLGRWLRRRTSTGRPASAPGRKGR